MKGERLAPYAVRLGIALLLAVGFMLWLRPHLPFVTAADDVDWPNHGNDLANTRFQPVDQINRTNINKLKVAWVFHTGVLDPLAELQVSPIAVDGRLFVTDGHDNLFALDAATGQEIWSYKPLAIPNEMPPLEQVKVCCGRNNKGVAVGDDKVFYGRLDGVVVALNAATGAVAWKNTVVDFRDRFAINNAPQFVDGLVIISPSGGEFEVRGQVIALDATTGRVVWRTQTTEPRSYAGDSFRRGGAAVWNPPAIDRELGLIFVVTGNAAPDVLGQDRAGDNLLATSIVALDLRTGRPRWHFQEVHHDIWDYDSAQPVVLFPLERGGKHFQALGHCSKNGNYYILDRITGQPIFPVTETPVPTGPAFQHAAPTQPVSSVEPLTPLTFVRPTPTEFNGEPITLSPQYTPPDEVLRLIVPGDDGGCEWNPAAFSPRTKFVYYGTRYEPTLFQTKPDNRGPNAGGLFLGSSFINRVPGSNPFGLFGATDTRTGKVVWKIEVDQPAKSGVLVAGDLVFFGEGNGKFHAADAASGKVLFTFDAPKRVVNAGGAAASPVAYVVNGREFIVNAFGGNVPDRNNFPPNPVGDAIIAFSLPEQGSERENEQGNK
ncbi:MAG: hypothetical protein AUH14_03660 [Candidatus Rokubacteria bacterium 13_2_20CM_69_15_1]|nr:MAG: hypothetical protein AUH14_03660 [Candidatus Rokubacteria bacterium 13_2_20CM_69_15_1]